MFFSDKTELNQDKPVSQPPKTNDTTFCKVCKKDVAKNSLIRHIGQSKGCKEVYGQEFDDMKRERKQQNNSENYLKNSNSISQRKKAYFSQNSTVIVEKQAKYDSQHKDDISQRKKIYYSANADVIKSKQAKYDSQHKDDISQRKEIYYSENADAINAKQANYDSQHKDDISQRKRIYYSANADVIVEKQANYNSEHKDEINAKQRSYNIEHRVQIRDKQTIYRSKKKMNMTAEDRIKAFKRDIIEGPNFVCFSCRRCHFKKSVRVIKSTNISDIMKNLESKFLQRIGLKKKIHRNDLTLCHNCLNLIRKGKLPKIHISNGLWLDKVPAELELKDLEQQLIARSLLFMKVKKLPTTRMKAMIDKVISVPIEQDDVSKTISELPRHPDEAKIVAVQLKRKLEMKNTHLAEFVRPAKCIKAVEKLKELGNPFYQDVRVNETFMQKEEVCFFVLIFKK